MKDVTPNRNDPKARAAQSKDGPVGVDEQTLADDVARYGALIANAKNIVDKNVNTPLTVSRFGFVNSLLRVLTRRSE
jgi:hypothetical protein